MPDEQNGAQEKPKRRKKERDAMAPRPGRKRGSTALHTTLSPAHLEEVHERLIWDGLESVQAYIHSLGYADRETGECLINIAQLKYYRGRFITPEERIGWGKLGRLLREYRIRFDPIAAQEAALAIQAARVLQDRQLEEEHGVTLPQATTDIDLFERMTGRLYKMKQEVGLIPQALPPIQRHRIEADVSQVTAAVQQQVESDAPPGKVKEVLGQFREFLREEAVKAEEGKMKADIL